MHENQGEMISFVRLLQLSNQYMGTSIIYYCMIMLCD